MEIGTYGIRLSLSYTSFCQILLILINGRVYALLGGMYKRVKRLNDQSDRRIPVIQAFLVEYGNPGIVCTVK